MDETGRDNPPHAVIPATHFPVHADFDLIAFEKAGDDIAGTLNAWLLLKIPGAPSGRSMVGLPIRVRPDAFNQADSEHITSHRFLG
jgi:hypothetical protein